MAKKRRSFTPKPGKQTDRNLIKVNLTPAGKEWMLREGLTQNEVCERILRQPETMSDYVVIALSPAGVADMKRRGFNSKEEYAAARFRSIDTLNKKPATGGVYATIEQGQNIPVRIPPQGREQMKKYGLTEKQYIDMALHQRKLCAKYGVPHGPQGGALDWLDGQEPPVGGSSKVRQKRDGTIEKTLYFADGSTDRTLKVSASGETSEWHPLTPGPDPNNPFLGAMISGTTTALCGFPTPFSAVIQECVPEDLPEPAFAECRSGTGGLSCCSPDETLSATGEITYAPAPCFDDVCLTTTETLSLSTGDIECTTTGQMLSTVLTGFDPSAGYFIGSLPMSSNSGYPFDGRTLLVWCDSGTVRAIVLDDHNCPDPEGGTDGAVDSVTWDPDTFTGEILLDYPFAACCSSNMQGQTYKVILG